MYSNLKGNNNLFQGKFRLYVSIKKIFLPRTISQWDRLPREVTEFFMLKIQNIQLVKALANLI